MPRPSLNETAHTIARAAASLCDRHRRNTRCVSTEANILRAAITAVMYSEEINTQRPDQERTLLALDELRCSLSYIAD
tara:strand:- start:1557 stop:1790 length:234 start_codon:yes stop_codon:yes gene_type:complete